MNKKFIKVSFGILISVLVVVLGFKFILKDKILFSDSTDDIFENVKPTIKYEEIEEEDSFYRIIISIKNNTKYYASVNEMHLQFGFNISSENPHKIMSNNSLYFRGYDLEERKYLENYNGNSSERVSPYLDPYEERQYAFEISKGVIFDEEVFDTNKMNISYNVNYYRYRLSSNSLAGGIMGHGGGEHIEKKQQIKH